MSDTPNGVSEPSATISEGAEDTAATKTAQETEAEQEGAENGFSPDEFLSELEKKPEQAQTPQDTAAKEAHESKMLLASARVSKLAREKDISKEEAAVELLDDGVISQDQANYLAKRNFGEKRQETTVSKDQLKAELRAEEKLLNAVKASKLSREEQSRLAADYRELSKKNSPEEAAEFALYRAGITVKQIQDAAFRSGQSQVVRPPKGSSPTTPKPQPKQIDSSTIKDMTIEEYNALKEKEIAELEKMRERGEA